ncbi:MAG: hypothetical protein KC978_14960, partial [Candidatus Omnitrophica bacterium]|nr:hypothetical protein [Candidatus Omnitrophota bacterium]
LAAIQYFNDKNGGGPLKMARLMGLCGLSERTLRDRLKALESKGVIQRLGEVGKAPVITLVETPSDPGEICRGSEVKDPGEICRPTPAKSAGVKRILTRQKRQNPGEINRGTPAKPAGEVKEKQLSHNNKPGGYEGGVGGEREDSPSILDEKTRRLGPDAAALTKAWTDSIATTSDIDTLRAFARCWKTQIARGTLTTADAFAVIEWMADSATQSAAKWRQSVRSPLELFRKDHTGGIPWDRLWTDFRSDSQKVIQLRSGNSTDPLPDPKPTTASTKTIKLNERGDTRMSDHPARSGRMAGIYGRHFTNLVAVGVEKPENREEWLKKQVGEYERAINNGWATVEEIVQVWDFIESRDKRRQKGGFSWAAQLRSVRAMFDSRGAKGRKWETVRDQMLSSKTGRTAESGMIGHGPEYLETLPF